MAAAVGRALVARPLGAARRGQGQGRQGHRRARPSAGRLTPRTAAAGAAGTAGGLPLGPPWVGRRTAAAARPLRGGVARAAASEGRLKIREGPSQRAGALPRAGRQGRRARRAGQRTAALPRQAPAAAATAAARPRGWAGAAGRGAGRQTERSRQRQAARSRLGAHLQRRGPGPRSRGRRGAAQTRARSRWAWRRGPRAGRLLLLPVLALPLGARVPARGSYRSPHQRGARLRLRQLARRAAPAAALGNRRRRQVQ